MLRENVPPCDCRAAYRSVLVLLYGAVLQALAMSTDVVLKPNPDAMTLEDFGITNPFKMEECAINIVRRFRTVQHFGFVKGYH